MPAKKKSAVRKPDGWAKKPKAETVEERLKRVRNEQVIITPGVDQLLNPGVIQQVGPWMAQVLNESDDRVMIIRCPEGGIKNRAEFVSEMARGKIRVVFLEYALGGPMPMIEFLAKE